LFTTLKRYTYAPLAVLALSVAMLALLPAVARAQEGTDPTKAAQQGTGVYEGAERLVVVRPGDTLWSISEEWLGPNATAGQIANGVERIYALNRHRIGSDPNLIFPGQELLVPAVEPAAGLSREANAERATKRPAKKPAPKAIEAPARDPAPETASKTPRNTKAEPVALPDLPTKEVTPEASSLAAKEASPLSGVSLARSAMAAIVDQAIAVARSLPEVRYDERQLLGLGFFAIAFGAALGLVVLLARTLRERRPARRRTWQEGYGRNYTYFDPLAGLDNQPKPAEGETKPGRGTEDVGPEAAGETRAHAPPAGVSLKTAGAKDLTPEGPTPKVTRPDGRGAGGVQGGR
jgi:hypothetical protein